MPDERLELSTCPSCDLDPTFAMKTTSTSKLTTQNLMSQGTVRACVAPTVMEVDGNKEPALFIVFHKEADAEFVTAADLAEEQNDASEDGGTTTDVEQEATTEDELEGSATTEEEQGDIDAAIEDAGGDPMEVADELAEEAKEAEDAPEASADPNDDEPDASDGPDIGGLTAFERRVYEFVKREGEAQLASIQGKFADTGRSPGEIGASVNQLVATDVLAEAGDDVYEVG